MNTKVLKSLKILGMKKQCANNLGLNSPLNQKQRNKSLRRSNYSKEHK